MTRSRVALTLDGGSAVLDVAPAETLADVLHLHEGCGEGVCGACTVVVDGVPVRACLMLALQAEGSDVKTVASLPVIEGSPTDAAGLTPLQRALSERRAFQCGWCVPGLLVGTAAFLAGRRARRSRGDHRPSGRPSLPLYRRPRVVAAIEDVLAARRECAP